MNLHRNVPAGDGPIAIACNDPACKGTLYQLAQGETLSRIARPGRKVVSRDCECDQCGSTRSLSVLVRESA